MPRSMTGFDLNSAVYGRMRGRLKWTLQGGCDFRLYLSQVLGLLRQGRQKELILSRKDYVHTVSLHR